MEPANDISAAAPSSTTTATMSVTPTKPPIKPPLPFSSSKLSRQTSSTPLSKMSRGARFVEMSQAKATLPSPSTSTLTSPTFSLMSPKPEQGQRTEPREEDLMTTPTQVRLLIGRKKG